MDVMSHGVSACDDYTNAVLGGSARLHRPVRFPCLAAIWRESLFPTTGIFIDYRPDKAAKDSFALERLLRVELTTPVDKRSDHRHVQRSMRAVCPVDAPFLRRDIE